jgi:triosephosphate isomerase
MLGSDPWVVANWKMNGGPSSLREVSAIAADLRDRPVRVVICPPATMIASVAETARGSRLLVGGQDLHWEPSGAHTGDVSAEMLADAGATCVIVGHPEHRTAYGESDAVVAAKARAAVRAGLLPIICILDSGEVRCSEIRADRPRQRVRDLAPLAAKATPFAIAYAPSWATRLHITPSLRDVQHAVLVIRRVLAQVIGSASAATPLLCGGDLAPTEITRLVRGADLSGVLLGQRSLHADTLMPVISALESLSRPPA